MGCDYYILKVLQIYYNENDYLEIELDRLREYYDYDQYDEDEDNYEEKINEYIKTALTPKMKPILIYSNSSFTKPLFEEKYKTMIEKKIHDNRKNWYEITKILKVEERRER